MRLLPASLSPSATRQAQEFAELLDGSRTDANPSLAPLVACAASLRPAPLSDVLPSAEFRARLRATLVEEAAVRSSTAPARPLHATRRDLDWGTPQRPHRFRTAVAGGLLVAMLGGAGASWASSRALPGDALYGLKRGLENVQLDVARSDTAQGRELLEQAEHRLSEAEALASSASAREPATRALIATSLSDLDAAVAAGADELTQAYADTGDPESLLLLDRFVTDQRERLDDLASLLEPALRARVRSLALALATLQARVETLLPAGAGSALGGAGSAVSAASAVAAASGDGWAVSRVFNEITGAAPVAAGDPQAAGPGAPVATGAGGRGTVGDTVDGVGKAVGGVVDDAGKAVGDVVGGVTGGGTGGGGGGGGGGGVPLPTVTLPPVGGQPLPTVTLPTLPPPPQVSLPPVSVPPLPSASLPAGSPSGLPCVPVPPVTHC